MKYPHNTNLYNKNKWKKWEQAWEACELWTSCDIYYIFSFLQCHNFVFQCINILERVAFPCKSLFGANIPATAKTITIYNASKNIRCRICRIIIIIKAFILTR